MSLFQGSQINKLLLSATTKVMSKELLLQIFPGVDLLRRQRSKPLKRRACQ
jgi:hypothetical protein